MHVMFIPSWYSNKRNRVHGSFFKEQALALQEAGINISVAYNEIWPLTLLGKVNEKIGLTINLEEGLKTYRYKNYNYIPKNPLMFKIFNKRMDKLYKTIVEENGKIDIIHAQSSLWAGISASYISKKYNIPLVITEHSSLNYGNVIKESYKPHIIDSYKNADKLIAVGSGLKNELKDLTGREDIKIIPNLIGINSPIKKENNNKNFTFFSLAYLEGKKGMFDLIKAFALSFRGQNVQLIIGGDGSQKNDLQDLAISLGIGKQVIFKGALDRKEVAINMQSCDAFVLASEYETFGVVYIEALSFGKPVIGCYNGGAEDIINSSNGYIVNKKDINELSLAMKSIKKNIDKFDSEEIIKLTKERYSSGKISKEIIDVYKEVVKGF